MDPTLQAALMAFFASNPSFAAEYQRHMAGAQPGTDNRSQAEWLYDHLQASPESLAGFNAFQESSGGATGAAVPLEQDLLDTVTQRGYADIARDDLRRTEADDLFAGLQPTYDANRRLIGDLANGNLLAGEQAALGKSNEERLANLAEQLGTVGDAQSAQTTRRLSNLDDYRTGIAGNIDAELAALRTGLDPVLAARLNAAGAQEAAVNLGVQEARDRAIAEDALKGFIGGSSTLDQSLARASIGGRQAAAGIRGDAQFANASDVYGLDKYGANQRRTLGDTYTTDFRGVNDDSAETARLLGEYGAGERRTIKDSGATGGFTLFENDINRRLGGLALPTTFANDYLGARSAADNYSNTGLDSFLNRLNWFSTNGAPPSVGASPTPEAYDSGLTSLGTGLASFGVEAGKSGLFKNLFGKKDESFTNSANDD